MRKTCSSAGGFKERAPNKFSLKYFPEGKEHVTVVVGDLPNII